MTILVKDIVGSEIAVAYSDGVKCLNLVMQSLEKDGSAELDFHGIDFVITAFLNPVIGALIIKKGPEIMHNINIVNATKGIRDKIKIVETGSLCAREDLEGLFI